MTIDKRDVPRRRQAIHQAVLVCSLLTGCAVGPDYQAPKLQALTNWSSNEAIGSGTVTVAEGGDIGRWWDVFGDAVLSDLVAKATSTSPGMRTANARLREARARHLAAGAVSYPTIDASGSSSHSRTGLQDGTSTSLYRAGLDASWELDIFGGIGRQTEAASADAEASAADVDATRASLAAETALDYVEVRSLQMRIEATRRNAEIQAETLQIVTWRQQAGLVSAQDVDQASSDREQTLAQVPVLEIALAQARHRLEVLTGGRPGSLRAQLDAPKGLPSPPDSVVIDLPAEVLRQRPDIRAAERALAAETARVGVAEAARYPSFSLSGSIGVEALHAGDLVEGSSVSSSLFGSLLAPIFNAGRLRQQSEAQAAVRDRAEIAYEQSVLTALQDVENALVGYTRNRERAAGLARALVSARSAAELARLRYSSGLVDFESVLGTERSVRSTEDDLVVAQASGLQSLIALYKALGGGWQLDESTQTTEPRK